MPTIDSYKYGFKPTSIDKGIQTLNGSHDIQPSDPLSVGHERQLLLDWHVMDDLLGAERKVHQPQKHPDNPILAPEHDYEQNSMASFGTVMRDPDTGRFRMWIPVFEPPQVRKLGKNRSNARGHYYESDDGITWQRPNLGLIEYKGSKDNNIFVQSYTDNLFVTKLPQRMRDRGRYAMVYCDVLMDDDVNPTNPERSHGMRNLIAFSEDGIHFTPAPENPIWRGRTDTGNNIVYNPDRDVFMMYRRATVNAGEIRRIAYSESKDLITWTQPLNIVRREENDPSFLYSMHVTPYHGVYMGLLCRLYSRAKPAERLADGRDFQMNTELAWSRDGFQWHRHPNKPVFIDTSPSQQHACDWGMAMGMGNIIEMDDHVRIYYGGREYLHGGYRVDCDPQRSTICLSTLRRDGFVSVSAGDDGGMMLTRPLAYPGGKLRINARTTTNDGFIKVAVREAEGSRDGWWPNTFRFEQSVAFNGDSLDHPMTWSTEKLGAFPSRTFRLHFWLENAELFSFRFDESSDGVHSK